MESNIREVTNVTEDTQETQCCDMKYLKCCALFYKVAEKCHFCMLTAFFIQTCILNWALCCKTNIQGLSFGYADDYSVNTFYVFLKLKLFGNLDSIIN